MDNEIKKAAAILGSKGGSVKSEAKSLAAQRRKKHNLTPEARAKARKKLDSLTAEERSEAARKAALARWRKK